MLQFKDQRSESKTVFSFSIILILKGIMTFQIQRVHAFCRTKNRNFNKNETESKMENPNAVLERRTLWFSTYKNRKLKVKLWWVGAREWKKREFFVPFILSEGNFFNICVLSRCIVYWIHFQTYMVLHIKKHYFMHFFAYF